MTGESPVVVLTTAPAFPPVVLGGLIAGVLDLVYAILVYSPKNPLLVPQTIASGILGMKSYNGGLQSAMLGIALHFLIAFGAATTYYVASRSLSFLVDRAILAGLVYGALVYFFMHLVVLPMSAVHPREMPFMYKAYEFVEHCLCVGLPIALSVRLFSRAP